jgi:fructose-bisphosphate aldolase class I
MGARFAKWRAVIHISDTLPSHACISANANALARYAALCQEQNFVPIVGTGSADGRIAFD